MIQMFHGKLWPKTATKPDAAAAEICGILRKIGATIAINVRGMAKSKFKCAGKVVPNQTPAAVEICQNVQRVRPEPSKW